MFGAFVRAVSLAMAIGGCAGPAEAGSDIRIGIWSGGWSGGHDRHWHSHRHHRSWDPWYRDPWHRDPWHRDPWRHRYSAYPAPYFLAPPPRYVPYPVYPRASVTPAPTGQCQWFNGDASIDASGRPFYGRACLFSDGRWHIVP